MNIDLDMYQMTAVAVVVYYVGLRLKRRFNIFDQYCIPAPVIGGVLFSLLNLVMTTGGFWHLTLDTSLQGFFMTMFFTSIGYTASLRMLKEGGLSVLKLVAVCAVLIVLQNLVGIGLASVFNLGPLIGMATGSIPMVGGHGTAGSFGPLLEQMGAQGAATVAIAAATFGLVMGSVIGGIKTIFSVLNVCRSRCIKLLLSGRKLMLSIKNISFSVSVSFWWQWVSVPGSRA